MLIACSLSCGRVSYETHLQLFAFVISVSRGGLETRNDE